MSSEPAVLDEGESTPRSGRLARAGGLGLVAYFLHRKAKEHAEDDIPKFTTSNDRARSLADRASSLIEAGESDEVVLAVIAKMAGRHTRDLKIASTLIRQRGLWIEEEGPNRVVRILSAAATGKAIAPPRPEHAARFAPVAEFNALDRVIAYERLRALVPEVDEVESAYFGDLRDLDDGNSLAKARHSSKMLESMRAIVGPEAGSENVIVQSTSALDLARWHFGERNKRSGS
jgi:hypothetical protein